MTQKDLKPCRDAFEEWFTKQWSSFDLDKDQYGVYHIPSVQTNWQAWQASWNNRAVCGEGVGWDAIIASIQNGKMGDKIAAKIDGKKFIIEIGYDDKTQAPGR